MNIYNKTILTKNGTLEGNWFEEGELRKITGEGRTIKGERFGKLTFDPEVIHTNTNPRDNTFKRVIGEKEVPKGYYTTNSEYGKCNDETLKYNHPRLNSSDDFTKLNFYVKNANMYGEETKKCGQEFRSFDTTNKNLHPPQPFLEYIGLRHMLTQDYEHIPREKAINFIPIELIKKMGQEAAEQEFYDKKRKKEEMKRMAEKHKQNEIKMENSEVKQQEDEGSSSFWLNNINKPDIYRSFIKGNNPWSRSSGFTQKLQDTRGAFQFYQNAKDSPLSSTYLNIMEQDKKMKEEFKQMELDNTKRLAQIDEQIKNSKTKSNLNNIEPKSNVTTKISDDTIKKIYKGCIIRGWIGLRALKCYLRNLSSHKSDLIEKNSFKYFLAKQAILLNDNDIDSIYEIFDTSKSNFINYIEFLNSIIQINETRKAQIESFTQQVKAPGQNYILFSNLMALADMNAHPEVMKFLKTVPDVINEYTYYWDNLKDDNLVTENNFKQFLYDISFCVEKDEDFTQIIKSLGYK